MKVLLINPPGKTSFVTPPLGLMYIAASLKRAGHEPVILDFILDEFDEHILFEELSKGIKLVCISAVTPLINSAISLADTIKNKFPDITLVLGGPHPSLMPKETLQKCKSIDFIVKGEGEERINLLIEHLENRKPLEEIDGIAFWKDGKIMDFPVKNYVKNLNILPFPERNLIPLKRYSDFLESRKKPATTMITSRGCPYSCIYCSKPIFGNLFRSRSAEDVILEMELLKNKYGIKEIIFYDDSFTFDKGRIEKLCKLIIEKKLDLIWKCETRVNLVDAKLLKLMKQAGCYLIGYGIESGNQRILNILKKGTNIKQIEEAVRMTKEAGIEVLGYFMLGIPGEREKEIKETIEFSKKINVDYAQFSIATAFPGTELYKIADSQDKIPQDWSESFYALGKTKKIISLCDVDSKTLQKYLKKAYRSFYFRFSYINQKLAKIDSFETIIRYVKGLKILLKV